MRLLNGCMDAPGWGGLGLDRSALWGPQSPGWLADSPGAGGLEGRGGSGPGEVTQQLQGQAGLDSAP